MRTGQRIISELEDEYGQATGESRFKEFLATFQALLDTSRGTNPPLEASRRWTAMSTLVWI